MTSFLFHIYCRVVNEPLESISHDLGFSGNTLAEGEMEYLYFFYMFSSSFCFQHTALCSNEFDNFFWNEGLVVSTCLGGAFIGSLFSGLIADGVGRRRAFQLCALPMVIGAAMRWFSISKSQNKHSYKFISFFFFFISNPKQKLKLCKMNSNIFPISFYYYALFTKNKKDYHHAKTFIIILAIFLCIAFSW